MLIAISGLVEWVIIRNIKSVYRELNRIFCEIYAKFKD